MAACEDHGIVNIHDSDDTLTCWCGLIFPKRAFLVNTTAAAKSTHLYYGTLLDWSIAADLRLCSKGSALPAASYTSRSSAEHSITIDGGMFH
jgi:hypothetical protein